MLRTIRIRAFARPCLAIFCATGAVFGQNPQPATPPPPAADVTALQSAIEKQSRQLEVLSQEIAELKALITKGQPVRLINSRPSPPAASEPGAEKPETPPAPADQPAPPAEAPPKAEPAAAATADGTKHTVAKGETLTSIAKRYNIPLAELEKANQIQDDRKLQIGRVLNIPSTAPKTPESPNQPKENP